MIRTAKAILILYVLVGLCAPFIANDKPVLVIDKDGTRSWPIFQNGADHDLFLDTESFQKIIHTPIPFSPDQVTSLKNRYLPPTSQVQLGKRQVRHWLGTDRLSRDLAAIMVHGCRKSLYISALAMMLALLIGSILGGAAGFLGNDARIPWYLLGLNLLCFGYALYLALVLASYGAALALLAIGLVSSLLLRKRPRPGTKHARIWLDTFVMRMIEVFNSIPLLLLLVAASAILVRPTLTGLAVLIGVMSWTRFARFSRAEVMRIKEQEYVVAAGISGENSRDILGTYILPEALPPLLVVLIFGISSSILLESTLSFLGIGLPIDEMTWGSALSQVRGNIRAWWLALFPGLAIFVLIMCLNQLADHVQDSLRSRQ